MGIDKDLPERHDYSFGSELRQATVREIAGTSKLSFDNRKESLDKTQTEFYEVIKRLKNNSEVLNKFTTIFIVGTNNEQVISEGGTNTSDQFLNKIINGLKPYNYSICNFEKVEYAYNLFHGAMYEHTIAVVFDLTLNKISLWDSNLEYSSLFQTLLSKDIETELRRSVYKGLGLKDASRFDDNMYGAKDFVEHWLCKYCGQELHNLPTHREFECPVCKAKYSRKIDYSLDNIKNNYSQEQKKSN